MSKPCIIEIFINKYIIKDIEIKEMERNRSQHYVLGFVVSLICGIIGFIISCFIDKEAKRGGLLGLIIHLIVLIVVVAVIVIISLLF